MSAEGVFKGWASSDRDYLIDGLLNVLLRFRDNPRIRAFTCTVDLMAHERLTNERDLPPPEKICARIVFPTMLDWYAAFPDPILDVLDACFDRNEAFMRYLYADWTSKKLRSLYPVWNLIRSVGDSAMEQTPGLQLADMVAWGRNRLLSYSHYEKPWEIDPHYATAVRAANTLTWTWREVGERALSTMAFKDEGYDKFNPQRRDFLNRRDSEFHKFERMVRRMLKAPPTTGNR